MKKITILYIEFLEDTAANHLLMMIKGIKKFDNYSFVCLCQQNSFLVPEFKKIGIKDVYQFDYDLTTKSNIFKTFTKNVKYLFLLLYIIFKHRIHIIHSHRLQWGYVAAIASLLFKIPLVIHLVVIEKPVNIIKKIIIRYAPTLTFIAVSANAKKQFIELNTVNKNKVLIHYGGVYFPDIETNRKVPISSLEKLNKKGKTLIGMISRMDPLKGVDVFIEAAGILAKQHPQLHFIHIGNQPTSDNKTIYYYHTCKLRITNLNLEDKFTFINYVDNVLPYYKYLYMTVLPSFKDTLAYVTLESNAFGVPTIATNIGGIPEAVEKKELCLIPFPPSATILAERIDHLIQDQKQYKLLSLAVKQNVLNKFNAEKNADQLINIYKLIYKK